MGVFVRNKNKRIQNSNKIEPKLINTNPNGLNSDDLNVVDKKAIRVGLGVKTTPIKTEINIKNSTNTQSVKPFDVISDKQNILKDVICSEKNEHKVSEDMSFFEKNDQFMVNKIPPPKPRQVVEVPPKTQPKPSNDTSINLLYDFIFKKGVITKDNIDTINVNLNNNLKTSDIKLSYIDLHHFKSYIKNKKIAIVANSSDLIGRGLGSTIDSYDIIIRFNSYQLNNVDTGSNTTIHASIYLQNENLNTYVPIRFILSKQTKNWVKKLKTIDKFKQGCILKYNHHTIIPSMYNEQTPPTTGFSTLILLLKLGGYNRIDLFGFNFYEGGVSSVFRNQVGMDSPISKIHNYDFEKKFIHEYSYEYDEKNNIITFYDYSTL